MNCLKTPVSTLQELMQHKNIVPVYKLLPSEGTGTHAPRFKMQVQAGNIIGVGEGVSKKKAKHEAAKAVLQKLGFANYLVDAIVSNPELTLESTEPVHENVSSEICGAELEIIIRKNAVSILKYISAQINLPTPNIEIIAVNGPSHKPIFTCRCTIGKITKTAVGTSKLQAIQSCAILMIEYLNEFRTKNESKQQLLDDDQITIGSKQKQSKYFLQGLKYILKSKSLKCTDIWKNTKYKKNEEIFESIMNLLDIKYSIDYLEKQTKIVASLVLNSDPDFRLIEMADSKEEASKIIIQKFLDMIKFIA